MQLLFAALLGSLPTHSFTVPEHIEASDDPALASGMFSHDHLLCFASPDGNVEPGTTWQVIGSRSMTRHGASALDTDITVTLLGNPRDDAQALLSQAMGRVALALATTPDR